MTGKPKGSDLVAVQVMREQEWAYDQRRRRLSIRDIARSSIEPPSAGGLGYYLSPHQVRSLVNGYLERMRDVYAETVEETITSELADLDMQYRAAAQLTGAYTGEVVMDPDTLVEVEVRRDERVVLAALAQMRAIGERRAKLLGTDAVVTTKVDVTVTDATDKQIAELAAQLDLQGR